jgi:hypothetical protein
MSVYENYIRTKCTETPSELSNMQATYIKWTVIDIVFSVFMCE